MNTASSNQAILARRATLLGPAYRVLYSDPVHLVRAQGVHMFDAAGKRYLDVYNNVPSVGHCHPRVVEALASQSALLNTHTRYLHEAVLDYAEMLLATFPAELDNVMLTCTGSEANDLAIRVAKCVTGNEGFIVTRNAYHGVTEAVAQMSPSLGAAVALGKHVRLVDAPDSYRLSPEGAARNFEISVRGAIADLEEAGLKPAALLVDTIFASDGVFPDPKGLLQGAVSAVRKAGGIFIADEVQAGLARLGTHMWGFERHGVIPDLVTLGKPMGNGHPLAGLVARSALLQAFGNRSRYFNTFGGNPVSAQVGSAVLRVITEEGLQANALRVGDYLRSGLDALASIHEVIGDVRSTGLYLGVELVSDPSNKIASTELAARVANGLRHNGVLVGLCGPQNNVLKLRPPLPFSIEDADYALEQMDKTFRELTKLPF